MYEEFVIGYVLSGVAIALLAAVIVLQIMILKKLSHGGVGVRSQESSYNAYTTGNAYSANRGTAICRNCATQFDSAHKICPKCGTPR